MHIPMILILKKFYFTPGDLGFKTILKKGKIGIICWDQWYPEAARLTALQGAEVLFYPTAIGIHKKKEQYGENQHGA
jgi:N-carbamoylputrescine amidase